MPLKARCLPHSSSLLLLGKVDRNASGQKENVEATWPALLITVSWMSGAIDEGRVGDSVCSLLAMVFSPRGSPTSRGPTASNQVPDSHVMVVVSLGLSPLTWRFCFRIFNYLRSILMIWHHGQVCICCSLLHLSGNRTCRRTEQLIGSQNPWVR